MKSLKSYFDHINGKVYIDKYPEKIIRLENLRKGILVEFGGGAGNDIKFLLAKGFPPEKLFFIELDKEVYNKAIGLLGKSFELFDSHLLLTDARNTGLKSKTADFIYANNMLHCLENKDNVTAVFKEAHRLLKSNGVLFGRTLLDKIDKEKLKTLKNNLQSEKQKFVHKTARALQKGILLGLNPKEIKEIGERVGFSEIYSEIILTTWAPTTDFYFRLKK